MHMTEKGGVGHSQHGGAPAAMVGEDTRRDGTRHERHYVTCVHAEGPALYTHSTGA